MSKYETVVVASARLEDEARAEVIEKIKGLIERFGGTVTSVDDWGRKRLAYEIQKMNEAYYYIIHFESEDSGCPNEMEQQLRIMDGIIRYLIVRKDEE